MLLAHGVAFRQNNAASQGGGMFASSSPDVLLSEGVEVSVWSVALRLRSLCVRGADERWSALRRV
eukprot:2484783-Rhodomonas_salina.1